MTEPQPFHSPPLLDEGLRIYAVGDIHGRSDLLKKVFARIDADLQESPALEPVEVFLGDYVDRGQDSAGVLDLLIARTKTHELHCLKGNHEVSLLEFLEKPRIFELWAPYGALATLASYGVKAALSRAPGEEKALARDLFQAMPESHRQFLAELELTYSAGDYFFVHAGVRPGVPLACQVEDDLLWIREEFLLHEGRFEKIIVHGHTPVKEPQVRPNRINIDTGAYATGRLTCLRLERDKIAFL